MNNARSKSINVESLIDDSPLSRFQILAIFLCAVIAMLDGFDTQSIAFVAPVIAQEWGVERASFGPIFSAALVGLAFGAFGLGGLADRVGRKRLIVVSTILFGSFSLLTAFASSLEQIMFLRFMTGLGLGGAMPNIIALTSEYSPQRIKTTMVVVMFSGFPLGGLIGGLISSDLIVRFGWQSVFVFGGVMPLLLVPILLTKLPESIPFLAHRNRPADFPTIRNYLRKISLAIDLDQVEGFNLAKGNATESPSPKQLLIKSRALGTVLLWIVFFTNLLMFYFLISWLPSVLANAGLPIQLAIINALLLNAGAVAGGVTLGRLVDRLGAFRVLPLNYLTASLFAVLIGLASSELYLIGVLVFFAGFSVGGGQLVANGLAANFYPAELRSTGVGWAMGFGRVGAILGPIIGGALIALDLTTAQMFYVCAIPGVLAAVSVWAMSRSESESGAISTPTRSAEV